ncbi:hypothetical protein B0H19DRAFT_1247016 [Mycena capillaripes]|nr:hypothetical protein B0H19DRAFT_1247016 [Mycena capillaripes]
MAEPSKDVSPGSPAPTFSFTALSFPPVSSIAFPSFSVQSDPQTGSDSDFNNSSSSPTGFPNTASANPASQTLTLPIFNNPSSSPMGFPNTASSLNSFPTLHTIAPPTFKTLPTSKNPVHTGIFSPATTFLPSSVVLPTFNNPTHSGSSGPVSTVLTAYEPISTVTFSRLQSSFSSVGVSSNILAAEVFLYGAYLVMFGFYLNVLRERGFAKHRGLTFATVLLFIFCTMHCALQIATSTLYNQLESTSVGNSESVFNQTFKDYSSVAIATNAVYITSNVIADSIFVNITLLCNLEFPTEIIVFPILLTLAVAGVGYTNAFWPLHSPNSLRSANLVVAEFSFKLYKISIPLSIPTTMIPMALTGSEPSLKQYKQPTSDDSGPNPVDRTDSSDDIGTNGDQQIPHRVCNDVQTSFAFFRS